MNKENTEKLWNAFPNLYRGRNLSIQESLISFGFECQDGWFDLVWNLSEKLEKLILELPADHRDVCCASQVKEKYGTLSLYMHSATEEMYDLIDKAEYKSAVTCEVCGNNGFLFTYGWCKVRCIEHMDKEEMLSELQWLAKNNREWREEMDRLAEEVDKLKKGQQ